MKWILVVVGTTMVLGIHGKRSRDKEVEDYSKIMEEYLLRTFDGGSRKDGGVEGIIEVERQMRVKLMTMEVVLMLGKKVVVMSLRKKVEVKKKSKLLLTQLLTVWSV